MESYPVHHSSESAPEKSCIPGEAITTTVGSNVKESKMDGQHDKVDVQNIFKPGHGHDGGGGGGLGTMAAIAALGNRNDHSSSMLPALMAGHGGMGGMGGFGAGLVGGVLGGLLFNRRGLGGGDGDGTSGPSCGQVAFDQTILNGITGLTAAVPTTALQTQNALQNSIGQLALADQQGFANTKDAVFATAVVTQGAVAGVKDAVQNTSAALAAALCNVNQNISAQGCMTREAIASSTTTILQKLDQNTIDELRHERDRAERSIEVNALRSQVDITNTNTATATQSQTQNQFQFQLQDLNNKFSRLCDLVNIVHQEARATNNNVIAGNTGAVTTGAQTSTASPTSVNT